MLPALNCLLVLETRLLASLRSIQNRLKVTLSPEVSDQEPSVHAKAKRPRLDMDT